jgi:hypothetical protein
MATARDLRPFPREAEEARVLLEHASRLLVSAARSDDVYDDLANLATLAAWACSVPRKKRIERACCELRKGGPTA